MSTSVMANLRLGSHMQFFARVHAALTLMSNLMVMVYVANYLLENLMAEMKRRIHEVFKEWESFLMLSC